MRALLFFLLLFTGTLHAQVQGLVTDTAGEPLAFASVYVAGSSRGTTTNIEGRYSFKLAPGDYELVFQYVGYASERRTVQVGAAPITLDVRLADESIALSTFEVSAEGEDPAYAVMRKAIAKRDYYRDRLGQHAVDVYIKGQVKLKDVPETFLGQDLGDFGGNVDSTRQGIVYLSESVSRLYVDPPNRVKEVMTSSKVSGDEGGFSFNSATSMNYSLYQETVDFQRKILSPLADNAFQYYRFRLVGTTYNESGKLVNKIELLPKRSEDPVFFGHIYIVEDDWNIDRIDVLLTAAALRVDAIDSLFIQQLYVPGTEPDLHLLFSQRYRFSGKVLFLKGGGNFAAVYTNYDLDPELPADFFDKEIFKVEAGANERSATYWDTLRPLPLTGEERVDYRRKDSLEIVRGTRAFRDSTDRAANKLGPLDLLTGYTYRNSHRRWSIRYESPLSALQFNPVQGYNADLRFRYRKYPNADSESRRLDIEPTINYGLADRRLRVAARLAYRLNRIDYTTLRLRGGRTVQAFHEPAIGPTLATLYALFNTRNFLRLYEQDFVGVGFTRFLRPGWRLYVNADWQRRRALFNNTDYTLFGPEERAYLPNNPRNVEGFATHAGVRSNVALVWQPGQQYISYPDRRFLPSSPWPRFVASFRAGVGTDDIYQNWSAVSLSVEKLGIPLGLFGNLSFRALAGRFLQAPPVDQFMDYRHFTGNQTVFYNPNDNRLRRFQLLDYYALSTNDQWAEAHVEHDFNGFLLDKLPLLRKLNYSLVVGGRYAKSGDLPAYQEVSVGLDNLGFGVFRLFRLDYVVGFPGEGESVDGFRLGVRL